MNITIIGAGNVGGTLAVAFRRAGHSVIFGVKDPTIHFKRKGVSRPVQLPLFFCKRSRRKKRSNSIKYSCTIRWRSC